MMKRAWTLAVIGMASGLTGGTPLVAADRAWTEAKGPHFLVASDAGDKAARTALWQFEQFRVAIKSVWPWASVDLDRPVLVLLARDESTLKSLAPQFWEQKNAIHPAGVFVMGPDRYYMAVRSDAKPDDRQGRVNPYFTAYWSYVTAILRTGRQTDLPLWLSTGIAEMMSNTIIRDTFLEVGRVPPWHLERLRSGIRLALDDVLAATSDSAAYRDGDRRAAFDAQAWVLVHYFMFADQGAHRERFERFLGMLAEGRPPSSAFELTLGPVPTVASSLGAYAARQLFNYSRVDADVKVRADDFGVRAMPAGESAAARAAFHAAMRRPVEARAELDAVRAHEPPAAVFEVDGVLLDVEQKPDEARAAYAKAIELGSTNFFAYYRTAALTTRGNPDSAGWTRAEELLNRAVALNGGFAPAYALLGEATMHAGRGPQAVDFAKRAVSLDPGSVWNRLALARVFWGVSQRDDALRQAREALAVARNDEEKRAAQQLIDFFSRPVSLQLASWLIAAS